MPRLLPSPQDWPAPVVNGFSVGLGLACITSLIGLAAGMPAAITAASGATTTSVADTVCAPQAKRHQMVPAVIGTVLAASLVALTHRSPPALALVVLLTVFASIFWMAWGKRGGPQTFVLVLTLVFQMAAFRHQPMSAAQAVVHLGWVALGALGMALWSEVSIRVLARRYRTLALAESLDALASMLRAQARWSAQLGQRRPAPAAEATHAPALPADDALLPLVRQQAGVAEVFQAARDLLYVEAGRPGLDALARQQIDALVHAINLRDVVQACQLDIDRLPADPAATRTVQELVALLDGLAQQLQDAAHCWRRGHAPAGIRPQPLLPAQVPAELPADPVLASLQRRGRHMAELARAIVAPDAPAPDVPVDAGRPITAALLQTLVSPVGWGLAPLKAHLNTRSSVARYALRCTLAVGCAGLLARWLPWAAHPHWILMTVAVVMRGNLEQTLARRDARVQGTLLGCMLASALLSWAGHSPWLFVVLAIALSLAHGFVLINYRVTAAAGAVLALVQGHLFTPSDHPAVLDAAERLGDTLLGAALAWAFSYVLPAWEGQQLPQLARRLMRAQAHYAHQALRWHQDHDGAHARSLARREVYDVLWLLSQSLQRMGREPARVRQLMPALEALLLQSNRLVAHLAAIKGLLTARHQDMDAARIQPLLQAAEQRLAACLREASGSAQGPLPQADAADRATAARIAPPGAPAGTEPDHDARPEALLPPDLDLHAWLAWRLAQTEEAAEQLRQAARRLHRPAG